MPKILFIAAHRLRRSPSQRFRFEQFLPFLGANGFECDLSALLDEADDKIFYGGGNVFSKIRIVAESYLKRRRDLERAKKYDLVFIQREALMTGSVFFEKELRRRNAKIIFDFDDAIWLPNVSEGNRKFEWMKNPRKTAALISLADLVMAGNGYLADYAKQYNKNVIVIPTTIDTAYHRKKPVNKDGRICIGWTGSHTTVPHFERAVPVLRALKEKYADRIYFKLIGDPDYYHAGLGLRGTRWSPEDEIEQLSGLDIGIMPLPDDEWTRGKCGLKGLQYMALETACVMSPVGVNREIISEGKDGFLAASPEEWLVKLSRLIDEPELRYRIGAEARKTVEEKYSLNAWKGKYLGAIRSLLP